MREYVFRTNVSILTATCLIVSLGSLRFSLHKTLKLGLFLLESGIFENCCVILFQSDVISIAKTENQFWAAPSSAVWITAVHLRISF